MKVYPSAEEKERLRVEQQRREEAREDELSQALLGCDSVEEMRRVLRLNKAGKGSISIEFDPLGAPGAFTEIAEIEDFVASGTSFAGDFLVSG